MRLALNSLALLLFAAAICTVADSAGSAGEQSPSPAEHDRQIDGKILYDYGYTALRLLTSAKPFAEKDLWDLAMAAGDDLLDDDLIHSKSLFARVGHFAASLTDGKRRISDRESRVLSSESPSDVSAQSDSPEELRARLRAYGTLQVFYDNSLTPISDSDAVQVIREKAVAVLDVSAMQYHNADAMMLLGEMFLHSRMQQKRNIPRAVTYWDALASVHGNATAQRVVGLMYATGLGVKRDYAKALLFMSFAALGNDLIAHQTLGYWHSVGIATPKSCEDAVWHYKIVADKIIEVYKSGPPGGRAVPTSKVRLPDMDGGIYGPGASGAGTPSKHLPQSAEEQRTVREIYEISAQEGDANFQLELASLYYTGTRHTRQNHKKALKYFLSAAKAYTGKRPTGEMTQTTRQLVSIASMASGYLGTMYWRGEGVQKDEHIARKWFERGEELGNGMSLNGLGMMALEGAAGFEVDTGKALQYFTDAAQKNYADAYVNLAELSLKTGNADALANALQFYNKAATKPPASPLTLYRLAEFHSNGLGGTPRNCATALGFYKALVEKADWHDVPAQYNWAMTAPTLNVQSNNLVSMHIAYQHFLRGTPADMDSAFILYLFAAERGVEVAQTNGAWLIDNGHIGESDSEIISNAQRSNVDGSKTQDEKHDRTAGGALHLHSTDVYEVALVLWNRAANQGNVDARVKMGDYHYYGLGLRGFETADSNEESGDQNLVADKKERLHSPSALMKLAMPALSKYDPVWLSAPRYDKAALYYQVAADDSSALAQWNVGWMHENGVGVVKDFPLAKRMYDMSLATNPDAYLAAQLSLANLAIKVFFTKTVESIRNTFSVATVYKLLKKYQLIEDVDHFPMPQNPQEHVKGAIPTVVDEIDTSFPAASRDSAKGTGLFSSFFNGLWADILIVGVLSGIIAGLFALRRALVVPTLPVTAVPVAATTEVADAVVEGVADAAVETTETQNGGEHDR
ncbi:ERAD-associated protein [Entophlyctis luteolus]|nr:ERAD-associated protein [Entophlyctis luteolus]